MKGLWIWSSWRHVPRPSPFGRRPALFCCADAEFWSIFSGGWLVVFSYRVIVSCWEIRACVESRVLVTIGNGMAYPIDGLAIRPRETRADDRRSLVVRSRRGPVSRTDRRSRIFCVSFFLLRGLVVVPSQTHFLPPLSLGNKLVSYTHTHVLVSHRQMY